MKYVTGDECRAIDSYIYHSLKWHMLAPQRLKLTWIIHSAEKISMPKLHRVIGRIKQIFFVKELYVGDTSSLRYEPSDLVWLRLEIKQNHRSILKKKKSYISYQFRADVQTYGQRPRYAADNDAAETDVCAKKHQVADASIIRSVRSSSESTSHRRLQR